MTHSMGLYPIRDDFFAAVAADRLECLQQWRSILVSSIFHVRHPQLGYTAVDWAVLYGSVRCLEWLLKHGFQDQVNHKSRYDTLPLTLCAGPGYQRAPDTLILLLSHGAVFGWNDAMNLAMKRFVYGINHDRVDWDGPVKPGSRGKGGALEACAMAFFSASYVPCMPVWIHDAEFSHVIRYLKTKFCRWIGLCLLRKNVPKDIRRVILETYLAMST